MTRGERIRERLFTLGEERRALLSELIALEAERGQQRLAPVRGVVPVSPQEKIDLFRRRFVCRSDVFPVFWENRAKGTKGYYPACDSVFEGGVRLKPTELYARFGAAKFRHLDDRVLADHLTGRQTVGSYAIRPDDLCIFLASDFDGRGWREAVTAYVDSAAVMGFQLLVEVSRSGDGAHAWLFFAEPISARLARALGTCFLAEAAARVSSLNLASHDRFFPNQDTIPKGGFGNLIGLPLQKKLRDLGRTVFVDEDFEVEPDQWKALAETLAYWEHHVRSAVETYAEVSPFEDTSPREFEESCVSVGAKVGSLGFCSIPDWRAELRESLSIPIEGLPDEFVAKLMKLATFPNPEFFEKQRLRFPVFNIPRFIVGCEKSKSVLSLPRGCLEDARDLFESRGSRLEVADIRLSAKRVRVGFAGALSKPQQRAVDSFDAEDCGVVVAPPGFGKTVIACALIGSWKLATVILVNRKSIAKQWRERLLQFTTLTEDRIGLWGGGKKRLSGVVDVVMMQSLSRVEDVARFFRDYSAVFVDECHHVPAVSFESLIRDCGCRKIVGLTATPQRKDRLEKLLYQQCGPIRYRGDWDADPSLRKRIYSVDTDFRPGGDEHGYQPLHETWEQLIADSSRNQRIVSCLTDQLQQGRRCLVLSDRRAHLATLEAMTRVSATQQSVVLLSMVGGQSERAFDQVEARLADALKADAAVCVFATGSFLGEGYDRKEFDTLLLCMPISFKGRVVQYVGRLHRKFEGKNETRVFDFLDRKLPVAMSMWRRRRGAYLEMGYEETSLPSDQSCSGN